MIKSRAVFLCAFFGMLALISCPAWADNIPVQNASFETANTLNQSFGGGPYNLGPIPSWNTLGAAGSWQPNSSEFSSVPDGNIVTFTDGGSISQTLTGNSVLADSFYTLSVFVGNRLDGFSGNYIISLDAGSTTLCTFSGNSSSITPGTFADETCTYSSGSSIPVGDLSVVFSGGSQSSQLDIDKVSVTTPEPGSLVLMAFGLAIFCIAALRRKVQLPLSA